MNGKVEANSESNTNGKIAPPKSDTNMNDSEKHKLLQTYDITMPGTLDDLTTFYDDWADTYVEDYNKFGYEGPRECAEGLARYTQDRNIKIIDLACGTGMVCEQLKKCGFSNIHAVDMSNKSLEFCKGKNLYKSYICTQFGVTSSSIESDTYDAIATCGSFIPGHLNQSCFPEMARIVKPGGLIVLTMREEFLWEGEEYKDDKLENAVKKMAADGKWEVLQRQQVKNYFHDKDGLVWVFKVL